MLIPYFSDAAAISGLIGGILIGLSGAIMLIGLGRIAGVSGIAARASGLSMTTTPRPVAALFILGIIVGAAIYSVAFGPIEATFPSSNSLLIIGGFVVGIGTRLGSGCTSGHGVCGMSRLSLRSLTATAIFIAAGVITVAVTNRIGGAW